MRLYQRALLREMTATSGIALGVLSAILLVTLTVRILGTAAVGYRTESMHGAGSPQAQRIMIARQGNLEHKKQIAKELAGID